MEVGVSYCYTAALGIFTQGRQMEGASKPVKTEEKRQQCEK